MCFIIDTSKMQVDSEPKMISNSVAFWKVCPLFSNHLDSDEAVQPPFKLRNSKLRSVSSLTLKEYSSDKQRLWSDCAYAQAGLSLCWSHIPHCWKSHVEAHLYFGCNIWFSTKLYMFDNTLVCLDVLHQNQQFFSHVRTFSSHPGLNQF